MIREKVRIPALLAGLLLLVFPSCGVEKEEDMHTCSLCATVEAPPQTKMSVADPVPGEQFGVFTWDDDARIAIHTDTGNGTYVIARIEDKSPDGRTATFRPTLGGNRDGYAFYPFTAADGGYTGVDGKDLRVSFHKEHYVYNNTDTWRKRYTTHAEAPMVAVNDPSTNLLQFKHLGGILRLHIDQIPSNTRYIKVRSLDPDPPIQGSFKVDMSGPEPVLTPVEGEVGRSVNFVFSKTILEGVGEAVGAIDDVVLNLPVPAGTYGGLRIEAWRTNGNSEDSNNNYTRITCPPVTVERGQAVDVDVEMHHDITRVVINPSGSSLNQQDVSINTLLRPVRVNYRVSNLPGTGGTGSAYGNMHITCSTEDPSIAQVYVDKTDSGSPEIYVFGVSPGTTKLHVWVRKRWYDDEVHGEGNVIVSPSSTVTVLSPTTSMDTGTTMELTASDVPDEMGDRTLDYTWRIVGRSGASDATISYDRQKAVLTAGSEIGWVDVNFDVSYNGSTPVTSATLKILIGEAVKPDGTVQGLFKVSDTKIVYFSRANIYSTKAEPDKYSFTRNQYDVLYSKDPGWSDHCTEIPYSFDEYDLFRYEVAETTFSDPATSPAVFWNDNDTDSSMGWYTLSGAEWKYLLETRRASTVAGTPNARYLRVRIGVHFGLIIFPDTYEHPVSVQEIPEGRVNVASASAIDLNYQEWEDMQRAGAVFLPCAGMFQKSSRHIYFYHNSAVSCWSRDHRLFIMRVAPLHGSDTYDTPYVPGDYQNHYVSVRLVKDVF